MVFTQEVTGTKYDGCEQHGPYKTKQGKPAKAVTQEEYCDVIAGLIKAMEAKGVDPRGRTIVHDNAPCHRGNGLLQLCKQHGLEVIPLPTQSPDLDPLDFCVFGAAKRHVAAAAPRGGGASWEERVAALKDNMSSRDAASLLASYKRRLQAVIDAKGGHIDEALKELKKRGR
jgi:hypothetical protein